MLISVYDSLLSDVIISNTMNTIQSNIHQHRLSKHKYSNIKFFIGLGAQKCGSTQFQRELNETMYFLKTYFMPNLSFSIQRELHYWDTCILFQYIPSKIFESVYILNKKTMGRLIYLQIKIKHLVN